MLRVKNKFTGTASISSATVSVDLPFAVTQSKSVIIAHIRTGSDYVDESQIHVTFTDDDTITFSVQYSASASIDWQVVEFSSDSDFTAYRGNSTVASTPTDIDLTDSVDITKSFPLLYAKNDGYNIDYMDCVRAKILDVGGGDIKLRLSRHGTGSTMSCNYQVLYFSGSDVTVDQYDYTFATSNTTYDRTVSSYDVTKSFVVGTFQLNAVTAIGMQDIYMLRTYDSTTIRHRRYATGIEILGTMYHVKFASQHKSIEYNHTWVATETSEDENLSGTGVEDLSRSFLLMGSTYFQIVSSANLINDDFGEAGISPRFIDKDTVRCQRVDSTYAARSAVYVIEITPDTTISSDWSTKKKMIISNSCIDSDLTDFNVVIKNNLPAAIYSAAKTDGGDIRFTTDEAGTTIIPRHIVYFNKAGSECIIWIKVNVTTATNTEIWVWSGNSTAVEPPRQSVKGQEGMWSNNIKCRWGMNDLSTSTIEDSTSTYATLTKGAATEPTEVTGKVYKAQNYDGGDYTQAGTKASLSGTGAFTIAALVKTSATANQNIVSQRNGGFSGEYAFDMLANGKLEFWAYGAAGYQWTTYPESTGTINNNEIGRAHV